jgi:hypothetical protein
MRFLSKAPCVIGILAVVALTASVADARSVNAKRVAGARDSVSATSFGGARDSVSGPSGGISGPAGSIHYDPDGVPYPTGHGGLGASPDFQLER